jgi:hypothetical protein
MSANIGQDTFFFKLYIKKKYRCCKILAHSINTIELLLKVYIFKTYNIKFYPAKIFFQKLRSRFSAHRGYLNLIFF